MTFDRILVTGGAGFIGSHTVDALLNEEKHVWVLDDLSSGYLRNLSAWKRNPRFHLTRNTVTRYKIVDSLARKVDAVVHLGAIVSPNVSLRKPGLVNDVNVSGTLNLLRAGVKNRIERFVFASSSSVYGDQSALPIAESNPLEPITPYGVTKLSAERYCRVFHKIYNLRTVSLRYFNVYGERQSANPYSGVIAIFANRLRRSETPTIDGDGEQTRDFIHVLDVVKANLQALQTERGIGEAFNIGTGQATTINKLLSLLAELFGKEDVSPVYAHPREGDIKHSYADTARSRDILGFQPEIDLRYGLELLTRSLSRRT